MKDFKNTYCEKYKKHTGIRKEAWPETKNFPWISKAGGPIVGLELIDAGVGDMKGKRVEFQTIRIYLECE